MRFIVDGETSIKLEAAGSGIEFTSSSSAQFSPMHMLAGSLAWCTASLLVSWSEVAHLDAAGLHVHVSWTYAANPERIDAFNVAIGWPRLPAPRLPAAVRAASQCTIENTLTHPPAVHVAVHNDDNAVPAPAPG